MMSYTDQQAILCSSFRERCCLCVMDCSCGRVHFTSAHGHGDYEEGELESLQKKAREQPNKYIEETMFDSIDSIFIDGKSIVVGCPCHEDIRYANWIDRHAIQLAKYLIEHHKAKARDAQRIADQSLALSDQLPST